ncbi:hypothetical protein J2X68_001012 [Streptomyces sp. 3330]|uniref:DUF3152 domain-containing protein n=1 Tax=Streptomyces sp. 3330 TaxID=2817755 RepID=UPI0028611FA8|nr:DUF3152 domain-containing protein [Streptomyces sp. 3330]MDR6974334.1 hypothetical protein [Streptomyces sp. 3330]
MPTPRRGSKLLRGVAVLVASVLSAVGAGWWTHQAPEGGARAADRATGPSPSTSLQHKPLTPSSSPSSKAADLPVTGPGTFTAARGQGPVVGEGRTLRYVVEVEDGIGLSAVDVAEDVDRVLADPRGWTAGGTSAFQRVERRPADFVVRVATPLTVDAVCGQYGLDTGGEVNCNVGDDVMVNLKRWMLATPVYADHVAEYRALIINHEVGHFLGHDHVGCPGQGAPAPVMMQQIKGMHGCVRNVWPYTPSGELLTGPPV